jgi:hypothetical protein
MENLNDTNKTSDNAEKELRISNVMQQSEQSSKIIDGECMICGDVADTKDGWICKDCRRSE